MINDFLRTSHDSQAAVLLGAAERLEVLAHVDFPVDLCLNAGGDVFADRLLTLWRRKGDQTVIVRYTTFALRHRWRGGDEEENGRCDE